MNINDYQRKAMRTANYALTDNSQITNAAMGLCGEAGELANEVKKFLFQNHDFNKATIIEELGDCLWYIALGCESIGISMEDIAQSNIDKLFIRYPEKFTTEHSVSRVDHTGDL